MRHSAGPAAEAPSDPGPPSAPGPSAAGRRGGGSVLLDVAAVVVVWAGGAAVFFRAQLSSGFRQTMGNNGDARLIVYLCEHWYQLFGGRAAWRDLGFFYPIKGLLGWSDSFFLYEVFYSPLRLLGCDPFLAFQLTLVALSAVGFVSFVALVRTAFGAPPPVALIGAVIFTFSNTLWLHVGSPQLLGVYIVPLIFLVGLFAWRALPSHPKRAAGLAALAGLIWALLFYTTYYVAWFAALGLVVALLVAVMTGPRVFGGSALRALRTARRPVAAAVLGFAVGIVPFALTYLPVLNQFGGLKYSQAMDYAPPWQGLVDIGPRNWMWSGLVDRLVAHPILVPYERTFAVTPVLLALALVGGIAAAWWLHRRRAVFPGVARTAAVLAATAAILSVLPVRARNHSLWAVVWHIPGAAAIRAIDRLQVATGLAVVLAVVAAATEGSAHLGPARHWVAGHAVSRRAATLRALGVALLLVAVVEQLNTERTSSVNRPAQLALLRSARRPPGACRSFFVVDSSAARLPSYDYQIDAMLVAQKLSIPTLNGYTAHDPEHWNLGAPLSPQYRAEVASWVDAHHIRPGLCRLDLHTMRWVTDPVLAGPSRPA